MNTKSKMMACVLVGILAAGVLLFLQHRKIAELESRLPHLPAPAAVQSPSATPQPDNLAMLKQILAMKDPLQMMPALADFVGGLDAGSIRPLLDYLVKLPGTTHISAAGTGAILFQSWSEEVASGQPWQMNQLALSLLIDRLVHLNPQGALGWAGSVANLHGREEVIGLVMTAWSNVDPRKALAAANQIDDKNLRESVIGQIAQNLISSNPQVALAALQSLPLDRKYDAIVGQVFSSWASEDPQAALAAAMNLPANRGRDAAVQSVAKGWASADPEAVLAWAGTLPNGAAHTDAMDTAIAALAQQDPLAAVSYVANITSVADRNFMMVEVAGDWAQDDPVAASQWVLQNATGATLNRAMTDMMDSLSKVDPQLAADDLGKLSNIQRPGGINRMMSITQISQNWAEQDPQADLTWLSSLPQANNNMVSTMMFKQAAEGAVTTWAGNDPDAATAYVESLGVNNPQFTTLMGMVASVRATADPASAAQWVESLPDDGTRAAAIGSVVAQLSSVDPQQAFQLAMQMPEGTGQDSAVSKVISAWSSTDPAQAAQSLSNLPEGNALNNATQNVAANWIQSDPNAAAQWIDSMPPSPERDVAAREEVKALLGNNTPVAFSWAAAIANPNMQSNQLNNVVQAWSQSDPKAAAAAVQSTNLSDATRARLMNTIQNNAQN
ncbi:MAG: hypothetical protein ABSH19_05720 [Opitutales bacterium]